MYFKHKTFELEHSISINQLFNFQTQLNLLLLLLIDLTLFVGFA